MSESVEESPELREAWIALFRGDLKPAVDRFQAEVAARDTASAAAGLLLCAAVMGANDAVASTLKDRWDRRRDAALVLWRAAWICAANGSDAGLARLRAALSASYPGDAREFAIPFYAEGHRALIDGKDTEALDRFLAARACFAKDPSWFLAPADDALTSVYFQTSHLLSDARLAQLTQGITLPEDTAAAATPVIMTAADGVYLERFGPVFLQSLAETNPGADVLILAIDTDPERTAPLAVLAPALNVEIRHDRAGFDGIRRPPVFASWRFLAMPDLLRERRRPFLVLDIDLTIKAPLDPLLQTASSADFASWYRPDGGPGGAVWAGATLFSAGAETAWMADLTAGYIRERFAEERENLWFVDQVALWRTGIAACRARPGFRQGDFTPAGPPTVFFDHAANDGSKNR